MLLQGGCQGVRRFNARIVLSFSAVTILQPRAPTDLTNKTSDPAPGAHPEKARFLDTPNEVGNSGARLRANSGQRRNYQDTIFSRPIE